ncbi:hypothetical protein [Deinococcus cellulosilyticus]|uniref:Uncharacterized protein n=1 Tax=Deinococcus cellulosilyticus (strain DSM 18568 / NBRC 106333 / KACC 11606 / 5516J-15) TaxID=1223518 RepID=A0A511N894_DEIC1|nr:hypothetical protein [Deinococcus cellulosilyticus]GEM48708.1 hypothetical protein DC3_43430 [Deinococcus cellulosilyticus NBRC 106333 = KACC 11606]
MEDAIQKAKNECANLLHAIGETRAEEHRLGHTCQALGAHHQLQAQRLAQHITDFRGSPLEDAYLEHAGHHRQLQALGAVQ